MDAPRSLDCTIRNVTARLTTSATMPPMFVSATAPGKKGKSWAMAVP
jgi:hypothetical protein